MPKKNEPELTPKPYVESGNIEAHIIADMLRIESITAELREFKETTNRPIKPHNTKINHVICSESVLRYDGYIFNDPQWYVNLRTSGFATYCCS